MCNNSLGCETNNTHEEKDAHMLPKPLYYGSNSGPFDTELYHTLRDPGGYNHKDISLIHDNLGRIIGYEVNKH